MTSSTTILLVEDDPDHAALARRSLERFSTPTSIVVAASLEQAYRWIEGHAPSIVVSDLRLPDGTALDLLDKAIPLVVMTSQGDEQHAVQAMKRGALDYVVKSPEMYRDLPVTIERALRAVRADRERERAEASLRESEERFRQLADSIQDAFWLFDVVEHRMVYASPAWSRVYGGTRDSNAIHPSQRAGVVHADDLARVAHCFETEAPLRSQTLEYRVIEGAQQTAGTQSPTQSTKVRWISERTFPVAGPKGEPWRVAGLGSDSTSRRQLEAALHQSQKMEAIGQLAGGVAHDMNNMLTTILAASDEIARGAQTVDQRELCGMVIGAAERSAELTRRLLAFSRKGNARTAPVDVHTVVGETVRLLERSIDRRVEIVTELQASTAVVIGDASQLQSALLNLGINARDAMPNGGRLTITSRLRDFDESACASVPFDIRPGTYLHVAVRDTGVGIALEHQSRVFEPFFTTKPIGQGTGLGLAAVYGTAVEHGGAVMVYSEPGQGTVFHLYLPLSNRLAESKAPVSQIQPGTGLVLIVDDEPLIRKIGAQLLRGLGYEVVSAQDGSEGARIFAECHSRLVAVLCDLVMPVLSGVDCTRQMRAIDPNVPIIICSGYPHDTRTGSGLGTSFDAFLPKPFRRGDIAEILSRVSRRV